MTEADKFTSCTVGFTDFCEIGAHQKKNGFLRVDDVKARQCKRENLNVVRWGTDVQKCIHLEQKLQMKSWL